MGATFFAARGTLAKSALVATVVAALGAACGSDDKSGVTGDTVADTFFVPDVAIFDTIEPEPDVAPDVVEQDVPPQPGEFGYACDQNVDCNSGYCVQTADGRQCTRACIDSCPSGFDCRLAPGTDATFICLPRFLHLCDPCRETTECNEGGGAGNYCLGYGAEGRFCGVACEEDGDCPGTYVCRTVPVGGGAEAKQCVPADGGECECSPLAKQAQHATTCFVENDNGKCEGTRFCLQSGLSQCDAATPFPESCNKQDDNCNEQVDEFPPDYTCEITNEFGGCPGKGTCVDGVETCLGDAPAPDICDLKDNDCDGETDNGLCDDLNPCTTDSCDPNTGECIHVEDNTRLCDDGDVCTQVDKCSAGVCTGYNPITCGDGNACKTWTCDPVVGCLSSFNTSPCEDGNPCTVSDKCNLGVCVAGAPNPCDDSQECTTDSCTAGVGCKHDPLVNTTPCTKAGLNACQTSECQQGVCTAKNINSTPQNPFICNLSGDCSTGYCAAGSCKVLPNSTCTATIDYLICSDDVPGVCTVSGECTPENQGNQCNCGACSSFCATLCNTFCVCLDFLFQ